MVKMQQVEENNIELRSLTQPCRTSGTAAASNITTIESGDVEMEDGYSPPLLSNKRSMHQRKAPTTTTRTSPHCDDIRPARHDLNDVPFCCFPLKVLLFVGLIALIVSIYRSSKSTQEWDVVSSRNSACTMFDASKKWNNFCKRKRILTQKTI